MRIGNKLLKETEQFQNQICQVLIQVLVYEKVRSIFKEIEQG
ncbi:unnamed protein product [Paramecium octaurelia]|uniref:Uncharacterized protein n=1 Tax=Paramecium octaurelia TaxID=43137 RepID=A0A8S1V783_PAROT|nr:unnamed protein product [Paramecium octaurelia]